MKTTRVISLLLAAAMLLLAFTGCQPKDDDVIALVDAPIIADLTPTDTLVLYIPTDYESLMRRPIEQYKALYNVEVEIVRVEGDTKEYTERVAGDLAGGSGPDVLFLDYLDMDIAKAALNNSFLDLTDVMAEDEDFFEDDYIAGVFDTGRFGGRQYTIPTSFYPTLFLSIQSKLEELGFNWESVEKTSDFLDEIARLTPYVKQNIGFAQMLQSKNYFYKLFNSSGIRLLDYENNVVLPDEESLDKFLHAFKAYFPYDYNESGMISISDISVDSLIQGIYLFYLANFNISDLPGSLALIKEKSYNYKLYSLPSQTGEIVGSIYGSMAISANSKNQLNAYNYIKMMLSEDIQSDQFLLAGYVPINKAAINKSVCISYEWDNLNKELKTKYEENKNAELSAEEIDEIIKKISKVDRLIQPVSYNLFTMMRDTMLPFFKDEKSYNDCLADLKNKLTFYLSE